jgi:uroporphyrinogen-III synthase
VGSATALVLDPAGVGPVFVPSHGTGAALGAELPVRPGDRVLVARGDIADAALPERLSAAGAIVEEVVAYRTVEGPETSRAPLVAAVASGSIDAIVFTSGSTVRGLLALLPPDLVALARVLPACCIGEPTTAVAAVSGFSELRTAASPRPDAVADLVASILPTGALS